MSIFYNIVKFFSNIFSSRKKKRKEVIEIRRRRYRDRPLDVEITEFGCIGKVQERKFKASTKVSKLSK